MLASQLDNASFAVRLSLLAGVQLKLHIRPPLLSSASARAPTSPRAVSAIPRGRLRGALSAAAAAAAPLAAGVVVAATPVPPLLGLLGMLRTAGRGV